MPRHCAGLFIWRIKIDRILVYPSSIPLETDVLNTNRNTLTAIGALINDLFGTAAQFSGLGCVPTIPASLSVNINLGNAYAQAAMDTLPYSSLPAVATPIMKQGIMLSAQTLACPAPLTSGFSVNYLVSAALVEADSVPVVLGYYNASNPGTAFSGPPVNGVSSGVAQNTFRKDTIQLTLTAGAAATTGTQTTPATPVGTIALYVVTVAFGATTIVAGNISTVSGAPILPSSVLASIQSGNLSYGVATGTANAHVVALNPALTARVDGMVIRYKAAAANTGALTLNDGISAASVVGAAHSALQGGETAPNGDVWVQWNSSIGGGSYVMLDSTGGASQVGNATQSQHAVAMGQLYGGLKGIARFTSSGSFPVPAGVTTLYVSGCAGGAGGGGGGSNNTSNASGGGGGGGGAGQNVIRQAFAVTPGQVIPITIGAAGVGGAGGTQGNNDAAGGTPGGNTVIGSLLTLTGAGAPSGGPQGGAVSAGGVGSGLGFPQGQTGANSMPAQTGGAFAGNGGNGASCPFGGGGSGGRSGQGAGVIGTPAIGFGGGGGAGGPCYLSGGSGAAGGAGAPGIVILEW